MSNASVQKGRLVYVEPNNIIDNTSGSNLYWDVEDLNYSVDLTVIRGNRDDCAQNGIGRIIKREKINNTSVQWSSFMSGENVVNDENKKVLTTNYTEISYQEFTKNGKSDKESLGITSININFDSHFYPIVTMNITDVRGSSLFQPSEYDYVMERKGKVNNAESSFFKSLFQFPYPRFLLTVKGFYGNKVTFQLNVDSFTSSFNSETGNYDVSIKFIGYMYGLYTDIPMSLIFTAPYYNNEYWTENPNFKYREEDGDGGKILTFLEFIEKYYSLETEILTEGTDSNSNINNLKVIQDELTALNEINKSYDSFSKEVLDKLKKVDRYDLLANGGTGEAGVISGNTGKQVLVYTTNTEKSEINVGGSKYFNDLNDRVEGYKKTYGGSELDISNLKKFSGEKITLETKTKTANKNFGVLNNKELENLEIFKYVYFDKNEFNNEITSLIEKKKSEEKELEEECDGILRELAKQKMGFTISVENIYRMIFAHIDTFMDYMSKNLYKIKKSRRTSEYLGLNSKNSDLPKNKIKDVFVPPFPLYKEDGKIKFPGDGSGNISNITEVEMINNILESIEQFSSEANKMWDRLKDLEEVKISETENNVGLDNFNTNFKPCTVFDILYKGRNPYTYLKNKIEKLESNEEIAKEIVTFFFKRSTYNFVDNFEISDSFYLNELENFNKAGIKINDAVKNILRDKNEVEKILNDNKFIGKEIKILFENEGDNNKKYYDEKDFLHFLHLDVSEESVDDFCKKIKECFPDGRTTYILSPSVSDNKQTPNYNYSSLLPKKYSGETGLYKTTVIKEFYQSDGSNMGDYYSSGILQVSTENGSSKDGENLYLGKCLNSGSTISENLYENSLMSVNDNKKDDDKYIRACLLVGSLMTYYFNNEYKENVEYDYFYASCFRQCNSRGLIYEMPKIQALYIGACYYLFKHKDVLKGEGNIRNYIKSYREETLEASGCCHFISHRNVIFDNGEYYKLLTDCFNVDWFVEFFEDWVNNKFDKIDGTFKKTNPGDIEIRKSKSDGSWFCWKYGTKQDDKIKELLREKEFFIVFTQIGKGIGSITSGVDRYQRYSKKILIPDNFYKNFYSEFTNLFNGFKTFEDEIVEERIKEINNGVSKENFNMGLYYTLKRLYDKWLCTYDIKNDFKLDSPEEVLEKRKKRYNNREGEGDYYESEFDSFIYIDSFYRDISMDYVMNCSNIAALLKGYTTKDVINSNKSVYEFFAEVAEKNNLMLLSLPVYNNLYDVNSIKDIFMPKICDGIGMGNTYILMYTGEVSSKLDGLDEYDGDGVICDVFGVINDKIPAVFNSDGSDDYSIPAFGVTYGKQNQMYFKRIDVNMDNPRETDYTIANMLILAQSGAHGENETYETSIGQNVYSIYSNRSYTCTVEMLGCLNIMPMMYFQLNNIPMFRGFYFIIKVNHRITPGGIITSFTGVRVSSNEIALTKTAFSYQSLMAGISGQVIINDNTDVSDDLKNNTKLKGCFFVDTKNNNELRWPITFEEAKSMCVSVEFKAHYCKDGKIVDRTFNVKINQGCAVNFKKAMDEIYAYNKNKKDSYEACDLKETFYYGTNEKDLKEYENKNHLICIQEIGTFCWRKAQDGSNKKMSRHAYGLAIDINWVGKEDYENGKRGNYYVLKSNNATKNYPSCREDDMFKEENNNAICFRSWNHPAVRILNKYGFGWGIYKNRLDTMHFCYDTIPVQDINELGELNTTKKLVGR